MRVKTLSIPWRVMVSRADPGIEAAKRNEPFYEFSRGRRFGGDTSKHGAYSDAPHDNPVEV